MKIEQTIEFKGRKMNIEVDQFKEYEGDFTEITGIPTESLYRIALWESNEVYAYVSTSVDANTLEYGVAIDSNNLGTDEKEIVLALIDADVLDNNVYGVLPSGFCQYPLLKLSENVIKQLDEYEGEGE